MNVLAASLNRSLWHMVGNATGVEARGKNNARTYNNRDFKGLTLW